MADVKPEHIPLLPRYGELRRLQQYVESKQYEGRPDFWTGLRGNEVVPLRERAPCIIYPLPKAAAQQVVRFTFGEGRFPTLKVEPQEDEGAAIYESLALGTEDAEMLEHGLVDIVENSLLRSVMRTLMTRGLTERTAVAIASLREGRICFESPHAKDCMPTFKVDGDPCTEIVKLVWAYRFQKTVFEDNRAVQKTYWFRRDITTDAYLNYEPVEDKQEKEVEWGTPKEIKHGLGFCPVLWVRNLADTTEPGGIDGVSLLEDLFDEFDALNFALSQRHRGITFFGTPQPYETGVADGDGPDADGRKAMSYSASTSHTGMGAELVKGSAPVTGAMKQKARKMSPDRIWSYEGELVKVGLVETTGKAFEVASLHVEDIRQRLLESMSVVLASIEQFTKGGGEMNAKFLVLAFAPLLNLVDELRDATWWPFGLRAVLSLCLRILAKTGGEGVLLPNAKKLAELVSKFEVPVMDVEQQEVTVWMLPKITPTWGEAFSPSNGEIGEAVLAATGAKQGGILPTKEAVQFIAPHFGIDDVDAATEELEKAAADQQAQEQKLAQTQADDAHKKTKELSDDNHSKQLELVKAKSKATGPKGPKPPKG